MENKRRIPFKIPKDFSLKNIKKDQILIVFLAGVLLLVISLPSGDKNREKEEEAPFRSEGEEGAGQDAYIRYLEDHLAGVLSQMAGVGDVTVMITLKSSAEKVVEKDMEIRNETVTEADSQGGTRTTKNNDHGETTVYNDGGSSGEPYVSKELSPQAQGVVVLAQGGDDPVVKQNITEAVQALFGIDTHKIRIMKKSSK